MSQQEITLLNDYHKAVFEALSPHLSDKESVWLSHVTQPVS
jgi:Xaa-Pro aminopeptidase